MPGKVFKARDRAPADKDLAVKRPMAEYVQYQGDITKQLMLWTVQAASAAEAIEKGSLHAGDLVSIATQLILGLTISPEDKALFEAYPDETRTMRRHEQLRVLGALAAARFAYTMLTSMDASIDLGVGRKTMYTNLDITISVAPEDLGQAEGDTLPRNWGDVPDEPRFYFHHRPAFRPQNYVRDGWYKGAALYVHRFEETEAHDLAVPTGPGIITVAPFVASAVMGDFKPDRPPT
jgi:hypothetical protein